MSIMHILIGVGRSECMPTFHQECIISVIRDKNDDRYLQAN